MKDKDPKGETFLLVLSDGRGPFMAFCSFAGGVYLVFSLSPKP